MRLNADGDIETRVYVVDREEYCIEVRYPADLAERVEGIMGLGSERDDPPAIELCAEYYQGAGLSRFRGV